MGHIAAAVLFIGPFTVASSSFPRQVKQALGNAAAIGTARELHRMSKTYGTNALAVPILGIALAAEGNWWEQVWLQLAIGLTVGWAVVFFIKILPLQRQAMEGVEASESVSDRLVGQIHMFTGIHSLLWVATLWLMVAKPAW